MPKNVLKCNSHVHFVTEKRSITKSRSNMFASMFLKSKKIATEILLPSLMKSWNTHAIKKKDNISISTWQFQSVSITKQPKTKILFLRRTTFSYSAPSLFRALDAFQLNGKNSRAVSELFAELWIVLLVKSREAGDSDGKDSNSLI